MWNSRARDLLSSLSEREVSYYDLILLLSELLLSGTIGTRDFPNPKQIAAPRIAQTSHSISAAPQPAFSDTAAMPKDDRVLPTYVQALSTPDAVEAQPHSENIPGSIEIRAKFTP